MPGPHKHLVEVTDERGYKHLLERDDGRTLLDSEGCEDCNCDGTCATMRKWTRCPIPADKLACVNQPAFAWLCEPRRCAFGFAWQNACYEPSADVLPRASVPASDTVLAWNEVICSTGCTPECTRCDRYLRADLCPGHNGQGPPVYVRVENVTGCGLLTPIADPRAAGFCYTARPGGQTFTRAQIITDPNNIIDDQAGATAQSGDCCDCVHLPCSNQLVGPYVDCATGRPFSLRCCCPENYCIRADYNFRQFAGPDSNRIEITVNGVIVGCYTNGVISYTSADHLTGYIRINGVLVGTFDFNPLASLLTGPGCPLWQPWPDLPQQRTSIFDSKCPYELQSECAGTYSGGICTDPDGIRREIVRANRYISCIGTRYSGHWRYYEPSQITPTVDTMISAVYTLFGASGQCRGNCGQGVVVPVPQPNPIGVTVMDPNVAALIERQNRLGGCAGCGEGNGR